MNFYFTLYNSILDIQIENSKQINTKHIYKLQNDYKKSVNKLYETIVDGRVIDNIFLDGWVLDKQVMDTPISLTNSVEHLLFIFVSLQGLRKRNIF